MSKSNRDDTPPERHRVELSVPEMDCPSCAGKIERSVGRLDGIESIDPRVTSGLLSVEYDASKTDERAIRERIRAAGYAVADERTEYAFAVPGMDCASCATKVEHALDGVAGLDRIDVQPTAGRVSVTVDDSDRRPSPSDVESAIERAGYDASVIDDGERAHVEPPTLWRTTRALGTGVGAVLVAAGLVLQFGLSESNVAVFELAGRTFLRSHVLYILAAAIAGTPIIRNGYYSARNASLDIDFLMSVGIVASVAAHHPFEGAMLAVLFSIAELLERYSMDRARGSLRELMELSPETASRKRPDGSTETVPASAVDVGDRVVVKPGEKIPTDGIICDGESAIDQSPVTGESVPVDGTPGDDVYAGTIVETGYLEIEVTSPADESTIARIVRLVEDAEREKTEREQFVDRFASVYTPIVVVLALAVATLPPLFVGWSWDTWFLRGLTLLVIACPCAFVISTPVSVVSGITSAARNGVLVKSGRSLEAVGESDVVAIDKTGTLTTGELSVTDVVALDGASQDELLARAAAIERRSEHPIAEAIVDEADATTADRRVDESTRTDYEVESFEALAGRGVRATIDGDTHYVGNPRYFADESGLDLGHRHATDGGVELANDTRQCGAGECVDVVSEVVPRLEADGKSVVLVGTDERLLGVIGVADTLRPEAEWAVSRLQEQRTRVVMLTGDNEGTARAIAERVGVDEFHAALLPEEKLDRIRALETDGAAEEENHVVMVGDGINDAPALATATVGVAMGAAGTDTALETADVALMSDDLSRLPYLFSLSSRANGVIRQNIYASLAVKAVLAAGAPFGVVTVIHAVVVGDMGMSLGVTGNAMRLANVEPERPDASER
ncbi:heavy metal translocating P-type ATPase [Halovivax gelatinilyticus]|uniref:heavy metal translocating P-type ATPase n=1 Tax=Halovivax gelatinilyticus TaxID=2961597 RepID=UPI0020CA48DB|nr:heavy metal translocating P-type ATPase [Halovivax gelatinilyticus]